MKKGSLFLIPVPLSQGDWRDTIPAGVVKKVHGITHFAVEHLRTAVKILHQFEHPVPEFELKFLPLNKDSGPDEHLEIIQWLTKGHDVGVMSEAGCPGIADPGSDLIWMAQNRNIPVIPLTGPSSPLLALIASGLNGQRFAFNGYLPVPEKERKQAIRQFLVRSATYDQTEIFIEAPHRNDELLKALVAQLDTDTRLSVASALTSESGWVRGRPVSEWQKNTLPELNGVPAIFMFYKRPVKTRHTGPKHRSAAPQKQKRRNEQTNRRQNNSKNKRF